VALSAQLLGMRAVVVMPETAPRVKVDGTRKYGAEVIFAGRTSDDRPLRAEAEAAAHGYTVVPPFDHRQVIAGAGTVGTRDRRGASTGSRPSSCRSAAADCCRALRPR
jgi:threonine dehydratase